MENSLSRETYKFTHQRTPLYGFLVMVCLMLYSSVPTYKVNPFLITQGFGAIQWCAIIMVAVSADFISMEYRNNTMITLLFRSNNPLTIYLAKLITLVVYGIALLVAGFVCSLVLMLFLGNNYSWSDSFHGNSLITALGYNFLGAFIYIMFTISLSLLLVILLKSNSIVIIIGLAVDFLGANFSGLLMNILPKQLWAWNPLNMINIIVQLPNQSTIKITHLSNFELILGNGCYTLLFIILGLWAFKNYQK
ncbi:ABC transporter permease [Limosilactobacillus sp. c9Ua_26_M]|uniref:ABC transporter permease n=1 Tax=Limosilactobacillus urinaemulieris TaxID=2742600 RepID=A0ABR8ZIE4_9LACO|nr:ABC transporter permease [Limosilactobacillus urinaemulieris]MBD8085056.1 ABC transporter permease [Limosilactobacillus urinaemulieris]